MEAHAASDTESPDASPIGRLFSLAHDLLATVSFDGHLTWIDPASGRHQSKHLEDLLLCPR